MKLLKCVFLFGLTLFCLLVIHRAASAKDQMMSATVREKIAVVPVAIVPRAMEGAPKRGDQEEIMQRLSAEATARIERILLKRRVAQRVERITSAQGATGFAFVTATVTMPIALPPGVIGLRASSRKGEFATAKLSLMDGDGRVLAHEEVTLNWGDVGWLQGGRAKRNIPLDEVLIKFTRKSVDRATEQLVRQALASSS